MVLTKILVHFRALLYGKDVFMILHMKSHIFFYLFRKKKDRKTNCMAINLVMKENV